MISSVLDPRGQLICVGVLIWLLPSAFASPTAAADPFSCAVVISEFDIPSPYKLSGSIAVGADGALWFTQNRERLMDERGLGRIDANGVVSDPAMRPGATGMTRQITTAPDGALWFTQWYVR